MVLHPPRMLSTRASHETSPQSPSLSLPSAQVALSGGVDPSTLEQLLCVRVPGRYLPHFVSSWDELVLQLRASRRRNGTMSSTEGRGQLALLESKLRVALDGSRPASLLRTTLEGRCKRCSVYRRETSELDGAGWVDM